MKNTTIVKFTRYIIAAFSNRLRFMTLVFYLLLIVVLVIIFNMF